VELGDRMARKRGLFQKKTAAKAPEVASAETVQQISEIAQQVVSLKQKLEIVEQEKEDIKLQYDTLKFEKLKENEIILDKKIEQFEITLNEHRIKTDYRINFEQRILALKQEITCKDEQLADLTTDLQAEKELFAKLSKDFEDSLAVKNAEISRLTRENLEIKGQVSEVLLDLEAHFSQKTASLETERESLAQEKAAQAELKEQEIASINALKRQTQEEADKLLETAQINAEHMVAQAQVDIAESQKQAKEELNHLKTHMVSYSARINEVAQTIDVLLGNVHTAEKEI
jgi:chromosome segregation ATPase